jgi:hypothetical protein
MGSDGYKGLVVRIQENEVYKRTQFLKSVPCLKHWSKEQIHRLSYLFHKKNYV